MDISPEQVIPTLALLTKATLTVADLTRDLATPSATRPGHERGLLRTSSGRERAQTSALKAAADPKEPIRAARCTPLYQAPPKWEARGVVPS